MAVPNNVDEEIDDKSTTSTADESGGAAVRLYSKQAAAAAAVNTTTVVPFPNDQSPTTNRTTSNSRDFPIPNLSSPVVYPVTLKFEKVVYKVKLRGGAWEFLRRSCLGKIIIRKAAVEKTILHGISGKVCPGEILAMLGPSGSGKTTLLTALGGRRLPGALSGEITYNGRGFNGAMRRRTGFVAQEDVLYPHLTVTETLVFTAMLRLSGSRSEKTQKAERVVKELGLSRVSNTIIGGPMLRGLSGGEKKRVSIGQEMLINPSLLLLDEPTSGLDSTTAFRIAATLKRLAVGVGGVESSRRRAVLTTIHQPSSRIFGMFDKVVLLSAEGYPIYYGPASSAITYFSSSIGFSIQHSPDVDNPADILLNLANGIIVRDSSCDEECCGVPNESTTLEQSESEKSVRESLIAAYNRNYVSIHIDQHPAAATTKTTSSSSSSFSSEPSTISSIPATICTSTTGSWRVGWWEQFFVLLRRGLKERRYESFNHLRIFQVISVATLAGMLWWNTPPSHLQDKTALLFFFSVFWGFFPLYNAVFTFPQERWMVAKERSSGMYKLSSYFLARTAGDLPMELGLPTAFVVILYWMGGLRPHTTSFILSLIVVLYSVIVAQSLGLAIGAILMDVKQASTLASVTTLVFLIAGGYYVQHIPPFIVWLKYLSYSFYCYKLLLAVQFNDDDLYECLPPGTMCRVVESPAVKSVGLSHVWVDVCIMALMIVGYRLTAYWALRRWERK